MKNVIVLMMLACFSQTVMSQESGTIVYAYADKKLNTGETPNLMTYDLATGKHQLLMKGTVSRRGEGNPAISPDGKQIIFSTYRYRGWKLAIADYKRGAINNVKRFTNRPNYEYSANWSHDGKQAVYVEYNWGTDRSNLFVWTKSTGQISMIKPESIEGVTPQWSHDDRQIVFAAKSGKAYDIFVMNRDGKSLKNLTDNSAHEMAPSCSPNEDRLAFLSNRNGKLHLYSMKLDGTELQNLTPGLKSVQFNFTGWQNSASWAYKSSWSPDGEQIVFTAPIKGNLHLFIVNKDGLGLRQISNKGGANFSAHWTN